jgi:thioesterase domain-containing protein
MAGKSLNKKNLEALGAEVLAELLMDAVKGDAARQRRVRMALAPEQSPKETAADIRKRLAQIRRAKSWISARSQRTLAKELNGLIDVILNRKSCKVSAQDTNLMMEFQRMKNRNYYRTFDKSITPT